MNIPIFKKHWVQNLVIAVVIFGLLLAFWYWQSTRNIVVVENSDLEAPIINLTPATPGVLNDLYVREGMWVEPNAPVALVGTQTISSKEGGIVSSASPVIGAYFAPGQTVVSIVNINEMKVVGQVDETKGLSRIIPGQRATFTVDAFPGKTYEGVVDEVSPVSNDNGIAFSISDKRPIKKFDIKVRFNVGQYPELRSGMSAKITVHVTP